MPLLDNNYKIKPMKKFFYLPFFLYVIALCCPSTTQAMCFGCCCKGKKINLEEYVIYAVGISQIKEYLGAIEKVEDNMAVIFDVDGVALCSLPTLVPSPAPLEILDLY